MRLFVTTVPVGGFPEWHPPGSAALTLSELYSDCSVLSLSSVYSEYTTLDSAAAQRSWSSRMAKDNRVARCNPYLMVPDVVLDFDPPCAITRDPNLQPTAPDGPATLIKPFTTSLPMPIATRTPGSTPTAIQPPQNGSPDAPSPIGGIPNHDSNHQIPSPVDTDHRPQGDTGVSGDTDDSNPNAGVSPNNMDHDLGGDIHTAGIGDNNGLPAVNGSPNSNNPTVSAVLVAVIGTEVISVLLGKFGNTKGVAYILPGGATLQLGSVTTLRANDGKSVAVSAGTKGSLVVSTIGDSKDTTFSAPFRNDGLVPSLEVGAADQDPHVGTLVNSIVNKGYPG
ncbi:hypothetical protein HYFRA_00003046 [Hymenoscyphus fraxineus]|uniref:Uncharacterized protein n=1 Tax=Hymenoscyphus fraxineus TaxID=746836 RepID=A0A9N9KNZ5_9HELO|nr:hypothetical protein HYFRA_00003046 [Hymenoscyphus fraxineus]